MKKKKVIAQSTLGKGTKVQICPGCKHVVRGAEIAFAEIEHPNGVFEVGVRCIKCDHFQHAYWLNKSLKDLQNKNATADERKRYKILFRRWQVVMKKKVNRGLVTSGLSET